MASRKPRVSPQEIEKRKREILSERGFKTHTPYLKKAKQGKMAERPVSIASNISKSPSDS